MSVATSIRPPAIGSSDPATRTMEFRIRTRPSLRTYLSRLVSTASRASSGSLRSATAHPASEIVDFRGCCSRTAHTAHDCSSDCTLPLTLRGGSTPTWQTGRNQTGCGQHQTPAVWNAPVTEARGSGIWVGDRRSRSGVLGRSDGDAECSDHDFYPDSAPIRSDLLSVVCDLNADCQRLPESETDLVDVQSTLFRLRR